VLAYVLAAPVTAVVGVVMAGLFPQLLTDTTWNV
jgi:hypothetical protein